MRALIHCPWCHSRTDILTDGNGGLVERLNHPCTCPPRELQPEPAPGGQVAAILKPSRTCIDCGMPVNVRAKRCLVHAREASRRQSAEFAARARQRKKQAA